MASPPSIQGARLQRLHQLASEWGIVSPPPLPPLSPVSSPLSPALYRTSNDDVEAEELLKRQRFIANQQKNAQGGIKRAFTTSKKTWEPKEIFDALEAHVANYGAPGVADALINKLLVVGGNPNVLNAKNRTSLLGRRKSMESMERSRVLQKAIENRHVDMVAVLAHHADPLTLDAALPVAMRSRDVSLVQILIQRGANTAQSQDAQHEFHQLCRHGGQADMVALILQSEGRPPPESISIAMVDASQKGCLDTVLRISRSTADGGYQNAAALKLAIAQCRVDIALAILTGTRPPKPGCRGLEESFTQLFQHPTVGPNEKMVLAESLLCAGATGDAVSIALAQACATEFHDLVDLLVSYGASVEFKNASVVRQAVAQGKTGLVQLLLTDHTSLSPLSASECVAQIPKTITPEDRHALLTLLLKKGAAGTALHDALIDAVQARDLQSVDLLVRPYFPRGRSNSNSDSSQASRGAASDRHETASVDHKEGLALSIATGTFNVPMVKQLLVGRPSVETLAHIFPQVSCLPPADRYQIAECFLTAGMTGPCVSEALQHAIDEQPPRRDEAYIGLLLRHNADVNFNEGAGILSAIAHRDVRLLATLLKKQPSPQTCAAAMAKAMTLDDKPIRYEMARLLLVAGAGRVGSEVSEALVQLLPIKPLDKQLTTLLVEHGRADANLNQGAPVILAAQDPDPAVLEMVLQHGRPTAYSLGRGLETLCEIPTNSLKTAKVDSILRRTRQQEVLDAALFKEVQTVLKSPTDKRDLSVLRSLLSAGADVNAHTAGALCCAVRAVDSLMTELLLSSGPVPDSLSPALPYALNISDPMDRLSFTQRLIAAGATTAETNRALVYAIGPYPNDLPLIALLASHADSGDGEALTDATKEGNVGAVDTILTKSPAKYSSLVLDNCFRAATAVEDQSKRKSVCTILLKQGITERVLSDALLVAAAEGDVALGAVLIAHGASVEHQEGQAIVEASTAGAAEVLSMLVNGKAPVKKHTLTKAFQAATQVGDLKKREGVFRILLEHGVSGEVVDAQLISAAKFGESGEPLVRLLLSFGASVDYNSGEAIWNATRSAIMGSLRLLLGVETTEDRQIKPSQATLLRALKASRKLGRDARYQVIEWLFAAGLAPCEEIHIALNRAVKNEPDVRLIRLLLDNGASPLVNACQSLIDAAQLLLVDVLQVFMECEISQEDISWAFKQAFTPDTCSTWLCEKGYQVARMLLTKGAEGESLSLALSTVIDHYGGEHDAIAQKFGTLLLDSRADVSYQDGLVLKKVAMSGSPELVSQILHQGPNTLAVSTAFPDIFSQDRSEEETLILIKLFTEYHSGEERLDVMMPISGPTSQPVLFRALTVFPRSVKILQALLNAGYYHDQMTKMIVLEGVEEEEQVSLLLWALNQPQKRTSSAAIELLIERGAKVNFETRISKITPLMLAIQHRRPDLVKALLYAGAEVDVLDITGNTPMTMATGIGGDLGTSMMSNILAADPSKNDGSLHNAARELNLPAMRVLIEFGHDPDFPSPLHGGRSALAELCLNATTHETPLSATQEKQMEKAITLLIESGSDLTIQSDGKSVLLLALDSADPIPTTKALLKAGTWKHVNKPYNQFNDGTYTYSPTEYVRRVMPQSDQQSQLLTLLKANRVTDVYYANDGPQPEGAVNLPEELLRAERERRAFNERIAKESQEHAIAIARTRELAAIQNQIFTARAELEDSRARRQREEESSAIRQRQLLEDQGFAAELRRRKAEREAALVHERQLMEAGLNRARLVSEAELEMEEKKQRKMIDWEGHVGAQRVQNAKQLSAVKVKEQEDLDRINNASENRAMKRITEQRRLVDSQTALAGRLQNAGVDGRRQIGYITGELD